MTDERTATQTANRRLDRVTNALDRIVPLGRLRPLERLPSIKLKLSILIVAAVSITAITSTIGYILDIDPKVSLLAAVVVGLVLMQILARGITSPLREMADATDRIAAGDFSQRVAALGADEVGQLGRSFNLMAAHIAGLEQQRRDLIANVSHELRTPIAVIQGNVENLLDDVVDDQEETLAAMLRQTRRLGRLVEQLLDLSRLEAGAALHPRPTELIGVIERVVEEASLRDPAPEISVTGPDRIAMTADPERLHQVFANLVDNAIRFHPIDEAITIAVERGPGPDEVTVQVSDRGPGIAPDELERVFDRFQRTEPDRATATGGSGLGLAIAKGITELHGGTIAATNSRTGGCVMRVSLPTNAAVPLAAPTGPTASTSTPPDPLLQRVPKSAIPVTRPTLNPNQPCHTPEETSMPTSTPPPSLPAPPPTPKPLPPPPPPPSRRAPTARLGNAGDPPPPPPRGFRSAEWEPPELRAADARLVAIAVVIGLTFDLAVRRGASTLATTVLVIALSTGFLGSGRLATRHSRLLVAAAPVFAVWAMIRVSPWLIPLDLIAAGGLLVLGVMTSSHRRFLSIRAHEVIAEPFILVGGLFGAIPFLRRGMNGADSDRERLRAVLTGLMIMIPVVIVLGALLASGDALMGAVVSELGRGGVVGHVALIAAGTWLGLGGLYRAASRDEPEPRLATPKLGPTEATVVLAGITLLYSLFAMLQVAGALGAAASILDDPTATKDWVREGFFQLLWAAGITLAVLVALDRATRRPVDGRSPAPHRWLRVTTAALTTVIVAMSISRIAAYSETYGLTMLRLYSMLFACWIAVVFLLYAGRSIRDRSTRWLAAASGFVGLGLLFALNIANPEAVVVRYDTENFVEVDVRYLTEDLSADAVPALVDAIDNVHPDVARRMQDVLCAAPPPDNDGWLSWNRSRARARSALVDLCG